MCLVKPSCNQGRGSCEIASNGISSYVDFLVKRMNLKKDYHPVFHEAVVWGTKLEGDNP